jgi:hypothetical protein
MIRTYRTFLPYGAQQMPDSATYIAPLFILGTPPKRVKARRSKARTLAFCYPRWLLLSPGFKTHLQPHLVLSV